MILPGSQKNLQCWQYKELQSSLFLFLPRLKCHVKNLELTRQLWPAVYALVTLAGAQVIQCGGLLPLELWHQDLRCKGLCISKQFLQHRATFRKGQVMLLGIILIGKHQDTQLSIHILSEYRKVSPVETHPTQCQLNPASTCV